MHGGVPKPFQIPLGNAPKQLPVGHPARTRQLNQHATALASGNPQRQQAAHQKLAKMDLSPAEHRYVQIETQRRIPSDPLKNLAPTRGPMPAGKQAVPRSHARLASGIAHGFTHAADVTYQASPIPGAIAGFHGDKAERKAVRQQSKAFSKVAEATTGYREIEHIRQHPIAGSIALAGILPFGRGVELGVDAARAAEVARTAESGSRLAEFRATRRALKIARRGAPRTDEQAAQHVLNTAKRARQQGYGRIIPKKPEVVPGGLSDETGGEAGRIIRQGLRPDFKGMGRYEKIGAKTDNPGIAALRKQQEEVRAEERSARAGAIERASEGKSGLARHVAAKQELEGKLPAKVFHGFRALEGSLPTAEHLAENPRASFIPIRYHGHGDITVGEPGGSHADFPKDSRDGVQGYVVVENGKVVRTNFSHPGGSAGSLTDLRPLGDFITKYDQNPEIQADVARAVEAKHQPNLLNQAIDHIYQHPHFQPYEKVRAVDALQEALAGKVPTKSDQKLLERAFGIEKEGGLRAAMKNGGLKDKIINALNVPRSLMASFDLSAPFRQGLVVAAHSPKLFASEFGRMFKAATSEDAFQGIMQEIHQRGTFPLMEKAKLGLTDIGETAKASASENLSKREEQFISNYAEQIPGIGRVVRGSDRAYVGFLNKTRADLFDSLLHQAAGQGYHLNDKLVGDIAKFVNSATGRGDMSRLADHTATMNAFFFSPRLLKSRLDFLNPVYYMRMEPFARRQALKAAYRLVGTLSTVLTAAKLAGATVVTDPHNADFAKIRIGDIRIDPAGGFTQPIRLLAELAPGFMGGGKIISSTTGKPESLSGAFGHSSRLSILENFAQGKLAPVPGFAAQAMSGQQFGGGGLDWSPNPLDPNSLITSHYLPLLAQDIEGLHQQTKNPAALGGLGIADLFGVGVQSYSAKKPKSGQSGYGGSSGYGSSGGYGSSSGYGSSGGYGG